MYDHGFMDNTNRQAVKNWLKSQTNDASLTSWRQPFCKKYTYSVVPLQRCQFSAKHSGNTPHISPVRATYGVSFWQWQWQWKQIYCQSCTKKSPSKCSTWDSYQNRQTRKKTYWRINFDKGGRSRTYVPQVHLNSIFIIVRWAGTGCYVQGA